MTLVRRLCLTLGPAPTLFQFSPSVHWCWLLPPTLESKYRRAGVLPCFLFWEVLSSSPGTAVHDHRWTQAGHRPAGGHSAAGRVVHSLLGGATCGCWVSPLSYHGSGQTSVQTESSARRAEVQLQEWKGCTWGWHIPGDIIVVTPSTPCLLWFFYSPALTLCFCYVSLKSTTCWRQEKQLFSRQALAFLLSFSIWLASCINYVWSRYYLYVSRQLINL